MPHSPQEPLVSEFNDRSGCGSLDAMCWDVLII
jgi:hypothetical protein